MTEIGARKLLKDDFNKPVCIDNIDYVHWEINNT